jgi:flagellin
MALYVNTNVSSLNAQRQLSKSGTSLDTSFQRLSSGLRINSAKDDAAGMQIANRLTSQVNGLTQGNRNANDGISLAQTAEGALDEVTSMFQRIRTLAQQASNGSNTDEDRLALQEEIRSLSAEVNRVAEDTTFGGQNLLDGTYDAKFQVGADAVQTIDFSMQNVGGTAATNSISTNGGFTLSGIAGVASAVGGKGLTTLAAGVSDIAGSAIGATSDFQTKFRETSISVSSQTNAQYVLAGMDAMIAVVDKKRAELGAVQNRFQSTIRNQSNISENLSAAKSRIQDTDFATETANLTKMQILQQASQSILSQANQRPQVALSLLGLYLPSKILRGVTMIDLNSTQRSNDNLTAGGNSANLKAEIDDIKANKGTEIAGREPVDIEQVSKRNEQKDKNDLIAEVKQNLEKLNSYIPVTSTNLIFEFDEKGDPPIIKVLDKENDEVIREIPTEEFREVAKALEEFADKLSNKGLLFDRTA